MRFAEAVTDRDPTLRSNTCPEAAGARCVHGDMIGFIDRLIPGAIGEAANRVGYLAAMSMPVSDREVSGQRRRNCQ